MLSELAIITVTHRALSDKELAERSPQVISCNEALREVTLFQSTAGKQMSRTFRFDKVNRKCDVMDWCGGWLANNYALQAHALAGDHVGCELSPISESEALKHLSGQSAPANF